MVLLRHRGKKAFTYLKKTDNSILTIDRLKYIDLSGGTLVQTLINLDKFDYDFNNFFFTPSYGVTTPNIEKLEKRLLEKTNNKFNDILWCSSGSDAIEITLKITLNKYLSEYPKSKFTFAVMKGAYHGNTIFSSILNDRKKKHSNVGNSTVSTLIINSITSIEEEIEKHERKEGTKVIGFVFDPINITGERFGYTPKEIDLLILQMKRKNITVIFDEVACGCYRHNYFSIVSELKNRPTFTVLSKGLTNGIVPLSLILIANQDIEKSLTNLSFGHTFGITPFSERVCSWVIDTYEKLDNSKILLNLSNTLIRIKDFINDNTKKIDAVSFGNIMRLSIKNVENYITFKTILSKKRIILYETIDCKNRYTFILAPPYDFNKEKLIIIFEEIIINFIKETS